MEDKLGCSIGMTHGSGDDSNSGPVDMEGHESLPMHSPSNTQNTIALPPPLAKKPKKTPSNQTSGQSSVNWDADGKVCSPQRLVEYDPEEMDNDPEEVEYDPEELRMATAEYFIISGLPFRLVEQSGAFIKLVANLEPRFTLPSQATLRKDCMKLYKDKKRKLKNLLRVKGFLLQLKLGHQRKI